MTRDLEKRIERLEDTIEIYNLQSRYNFYLTMYMGKQAVNELFADHLDVCNVINGGRWVGKESVMRMFANLDQVHKEMPGRMGSIMAIQPLITFSDDGSEADGQRFGMGPSVLPVKNSEEDLEHLEALWMFGRYHCKHIKQKGVWKILQLGFSLHFLSSPDKGWVEQTQPHYVRPFESEEGGDPDTPKTFPDLYSPEGPNRYGPKPPE